ncbi:hypothetical protein RND81_14G185400 [Saponaria officinalis]|uniref:Nucleotide-diphospho-sugar transferase domain-containing protein n=1 Tax=Saponaria officinalis TaxID=3572 RepID=A0AAW1GU93_SAPOF
MEDGKNWSNHTMTVDFSSPTKPLDYTRVLKMAVLCSTVVIAFLVLSCASYNNFGQSFPTLYGLKYNISSSNSSSLVHNETVVKDKYYELKKVLKAAATEEKTVIITTLNEAWAAPNSVFDLFLQSFKVGNDTAKLLRHLVVIAVDDKAYERCINTVSHCYLLKSNQSTQMAHEAIFMTPIYMDMMWDRLAFLQTILSLGYNFVFTDTDVMWFRSPFPQFIPYSDIQTSCDVFNGQQFNLTNFPNNGFVFVRSNRRAIKFYKFWVSSRHTYPGLNEQEVFNQIKDGPFAKTIRIRIRFLSTDYFGGYCSPSKDFNKVCTMHANCCIGLDRKIADLNTTIEDWNNYFHSNRRTSQPSYWRVPHKCLM